MFENSHQHTSAGRGSIVSPHTNMYNTNTEGRAGNENHTTFQPQACVPLAAISQQKGTTALLISASSIYSTGEDSELKYHHTLRDRGGAGAMGISLGETNTPSASDPYHSNPHYISAGKPASVSQTPRQIKSPRSQHSVPGNMTQQQQQYGIRRSVILSSAPSTHSFVSSVKGGSSRGALKSGFGGRGERGRHGSLKNGNANEEEMTATTSNKHEANVNEVHTKSGIVRSFIGGGLGNAPPQASPKKRQQPCTLRLALVFTAQSLFVIASFVAIISFSAIQTETTATDLIRNDVRSSLSFASMRVSSPLQAVESLIIEYRARYHTLGVITRGALTPCDDTSAATLWSSLITANSSYHFDSRSLSITNSSELSLQDSSHFYSDMELAMEATPDIAAAFVAAQVGESPIDWPTVQSFSDIAHDVSQCSISKTSLYRRYRGLARTTVGVPATSTALRFVTTAHTNFTLPRALGNLDNHFPTNNDPDPKVRADEHEDGHIIATLTATALRSVPIAKGELGVFLLYVTPLSYVVTNATSGATATFLEAEVPLALFENRPDVAGIRVMNGLGFGYSMSDYYDIAMKITPSDPNAHTSIYEVTNGYLLASTSLPQDAQYAKYPAIALYIAGHSPNVFANDVYQRSGVAKQNEDLVNVNFGDNGNDQFIVSSMVFAMPASKTRYGVVQSTPRRYYFEAIDRTRNVMIILGVLCCAVVVAICIAVAVGIFHSIGQLLDNMALAAQMKNDRTSYIVTFLHEVDRLAKGFGKMNDKLLEARAYLPQHLLVTTSDESEHEDADEDESRSPSRAQSRLGGRRPTESSIRSSTIRSGTADNANMRGYTDAQIDHSNSTRGGHSHNTNNMNKATNLPQADHRNVASLAHPSSSSSSNSHGLSLKRVTVLSINGRFLHANPAFDALISGRSTTSKTVNLMTQWVSGIAHNHKGVIDSFHGDHFVVSFNAARSNAEGPVKAARCALDISHVGTESGRLFAMGISSGRACVGNMGTSTLKRLSIIGPVYSKAMALERVCRRFNPRARDQKQQEALDDSEYPIQVIVDSAMATELQHHFTLQVLGGLYGAPYFETLTPTDNYMNSVRTNIYAVRCSVVADGRDEWMYEIQQTGGSSSLLAGINKTILKYIQSLPKPRVDFPNISYQTALGELQKDALAARDIFDSMNSDTFDVYDRSALLHLEDLCRAAALERNNDMQSLLSTPRISRIVSTLSSRVVEKCSSFEEGQEWGSYGRGFEPPMTAVGCYFSGTF